MFNLNIDSARECFKPLDRGHWHLSGLAECSTWCLVLRSTNST